MHNQQVQGCLELSQIKRSVPQDYSEPFAYKLLSVLTPIRVFRLQYTMDLIQSQRCYHSGCAVTTVDLYRRVGSSMCRYLVSRYMYLGIVVVPQVDGTQVGRVPQVDSNQVGRVPQVDSTQVGRVPQVDSTQVGRVPQVDSTQVGRVPQVDSTRWQSALSRCTRWQYSVLLCSIGR